MAVPAGELGPERCSACGAKLYVDGDGPQPCLQCRDCLAGECEPDDEHHHPDCDRER